MPHGTLFPVNFILILSLQKEGSSHVRKRCFFPPHGDAQPVLCALMAALTAICSQIQIPLPMVPIKLALFAVHLSVAARCWAGNTARSLWSSYALLGVIGVPVFAGFGSGPAVPLRQDRRRLYSGLHPLRADRRRALP